MAERTSINPMGHDHEVYRYLLGGPSASGGRNLSSVPTRQAARCRCGWEGVGPDEIEAHEAIVAAERAGEQGG